MSVISSNAIESLLSDNAIRRIESLLSNNEIREVVSVILSTNAIRR